MTALDSRDADRLRKLLGMLGSAHDGEALNAARKVNELVRRNGVAWADVIAPTGARPCTPGDSDDLIAVCLDSGEVNGWETDFLVGVRGQRQPLSKKQRAILDKLVARIRRAAA
jgi:hypothetical protein